MKATLFTLAILGSITISASTNSKSQPLPGHEFTIHKTELDESEFDPGDSGSNAVWSFSSIPANSYNIMVEASYTSQYYSEFPNSDLVIQNHHFGTHETSFGDEHYHFYRYYNKTLVKLGHVDVNSKTGEKEVTHFLNNETKMKDSFYYGFSFSDEWEANYKDFDTGKDVYWSDAKTTCDFDAYGVLEINGKLIDEVYRVKRERSFTERSAGSPTIEHKYVYYEYWKENIPFPIAALEHRISTTGGQDRYFAYFLNSNHFLPTGVNELNSNSAEITVYPNPARDVINLNVSGSINPLEGITLHDGQGRTLRTWSRSDLNGMNDNVQLNVDLPSGMYFLNIQIDGQLKTERISII